MGRLVKNDEELFTAWWFSNGRYQAVDQLDRRWRMLTGDPPFVLVTVTSETPGRSA